MTCTPVLHSQNMYRVRQFFLILNQVSAFILERVNKIKEILHLSQRKRQVSFKPQPLDFMKL